MTALAWFLAGIATGLAAAALLYFTIAGGFSDD